MEAAFGDETFYAALGEMEALAPPEVLERRPDAEDPGIVHLRVRYSFAGHLAPAVRAVIDPAKVTWIDHSTFDRSRHRVDFRMVPEHYGDRFSCSGSYRFVADDDDPGVTRQLMEGEVVVRYPLVAGLVERGIISGLRQHMGEEAMLLERWAATS